MGHKQIILFVYYTEISYYLEFMAYKNVRGVNQGLQQGIIGNGRKIFHLTSEAKRKTRNYGIVPPKFQCMAMVMGLMSSIFATTIP